jgi:hypothetical protein
LHASDICHRRGKSTVWKNVQLAYETTVDIPDGHFYQGMKGDPVCIDIGAEYGWPKSYMAVAYLGESPVAELSAKLGNPTDLSSSAPGEIAVGGNLNKIPHRILENIVCAGSYTYSGSSIVLAETAILGALEVLYEEKFIHSPPPPYRQRVVFQRAKCVMVCCLLLLTVVCVNLIFCRGLARS